MPRPPGRGIRKEFRERQSRPEPPQAQHARAKLAASRVERMRYAASRDLAHAAFQILDLHVDYRWQSKSGNNLARQLTATTIDRNMEIVP